MGGSARLVERLDAQEALAWMLRAPGGALAMMVMSASGSAVEASPTPEAAARLDAAVARALDAGAARALAWQAVGRVAEGEPMTVVAAAARSRRDAKRALDVLVDGLRGVTTRRDLP